MGPERIVMKTRSNRLFAMALILTLVFLGTVYGKDIMEAILLEAQRFAFINPRLYIMLIIVFISIYGFGYFTSRSRHI